MADNYITYPLVGGDTLESIAQRFLGNANRWPELAALNQLRHPFVSSDPTTRLGRVQANLILAQAASIGATTLTLIQAHPALRKGSVLRLEQISASGRTADEVRVTEVNRSSGIVALASALNYAYLAAQIVKLYSPAEDLASKVLQPGDVLLIPNEQADYVLPRPDFLKGLGIDLDATLGPTPQVQLAATQALWYAPLPDNATPSPTQDVATVSGVSTIRQAVLHRLNVGVGELPLHEEYGNPLVANLGDRMQSYFVLLGEGYIRQALEGDERIAGVENVDIAINGDALTVDVDVLVQDTIQLLSLKNLAIGV